MSPGIVGWTSVNGRNNNTWLKKNEMDVWYVEHVSYMFDLKIFFLAIKTIICRDGVSKREKLQQFLLTGRIERSRVKDESARY